MVFTILHAGGKFGGGGYKVSGGLHGVGASVVNALSQWLEVRVHKDGNIYEMKFARGQVTQPMQIVGKTDRTGTDVVFQPDPEMFTETTEYDYETLHTRMREEAFLNAGLTITIADRRGEGGHLRHHVLCRRHPGVCHLHQPEQDPHPRRGDLHGRLQRGRHGGGLPPIQRQLQRDHCLLCQQRPHPRRGMHEEGFKRALTNALNAYGRKMKILKEDEKVTGEDCREGLTCVISVKLTEAQFEGQTKAKLGNSEIRTPGQRHRLGEAGAVPGGKPRRGEGHPGKGPYRLPGPGGRPKGPGVRPAEDRPGIRPDAR